MASIFTFDPDPPRVSSPWSAPPPPDPQSGHAIPQDSASGGLRANVEAHRSANTDSATPEVDYSAITRLDAEPQEGPTEYKLHLLLRRRRSFTFTSTGRNISGSLRRVDIPTASFPNRSVSEPDVVATTPPPLAAVQSRQHRLEQLTTQLLWRLQQSSPNHASIATDWVPPQFPEEAQLSVSAVPRRVLPGLEESKGALYEIGIADDGTFVGLANDEMEESLNNLRAMAASLGCYVEVLRMVPVGECEWIEHVVTSGSVERRLRKSELCVAEAYVRPDQHRVGQGDAVAPPDDPHRTTPSLSDSSHSRQITLNEKDATPQLRVSLTGATMSGKSSLLGSLSTSTLDNGRGKSRLSLLKHRHEIQSGMTSSVTQELIGYTDVVRQDRTRIQTQVISYGAGNVSSWVDIHASAEHGRLVFLSDSAGHPRFRRTTVRGLVGWDPHWTLLCIPADNTESSSGRVGASPSSQEILGPAAADVDLSHSHLQLCLNLRLPLVVIITKLDIATKPGLRQSLAKILSSLKEAGRKPFIISDTSPGVSETELNIITDTDFVEAENAVRMLTTSPLETVPILLTSALRGTGIRKLHALLRSLPIPAVTEATNTPSRMLFHIEDIYSTRDAHSRLTAAGSSSSTPSVVVGGHLRYGTLCLGDELVLGPYPVDNSPEDSDSGSGRGSTPPNRSSRHSSVPASRSFPGAHKKQPALQVPRPNSYLSDKRVEWRRVRITSIRNLRLPVRSLSAGQVGTIGVVSLGEPITTPALVRIRKGMVLSDGALKASRVITVRFTGPIADTVKSLTVGSAVVVYVASVRASAKVISVAADHASVAQSTSAEPDDDDDAFGFGGFDDADDTLDNAIEGLQSDSTAARSTSVTLQFIGSREFVETGAKVLVLPGGGPGLFGGTERGEKGVAGLEGFVGYVIEDAV